MNRVDYRLTMRAARVAAAKLAPNRSAIVGGFEIGGVLYSIRAERTGGRAALSVATSRLCERPRRALAADALQWAASYRRDARRNGRYARAGNIRAAHACVCEAAEYVTVFNSLP